MNTASSLSNQITGYLRVLNDRQKKALLIVAKAFADEQEMEPVEYSDAFVAELDRRTLSLEKGEVEGAKWDEVKRKARAKVKAKAKGK